MSEAPEDLLRAIPDMVLDVKDSQDAYKVDYAKSLDELAYREKLTVVEKLEHSLNEERSMLGQRKLYAFLLLGLSIVWLGYIGAFLWYFGQVTVAAKPDGPRPVSDTVIVALITTTTLNVLGLFYIVARWLFPQKSAEAKQA